MRVTIKIRFDATKQEIEKFSSDKYIMYLPFPEEPSTGRIILSLLSKYFGVPEQRVVYKGRDANKDFIFEVL